MKPEYKQKAIFLAIVLAATAVIGLGCGFLGAFIANSTTDKVVIQRAEKAGTDGKKQPQMMVWRWPALFFPRTFPLQQKKWRSASSGTVPRFPVARAAA